MWLAGFVFSCHLPDSFSLPDSFFIYGIDGGTFQFGCRCTKWAPLEMDQWTMACPARQILERRSYPFKRNDASSYPWKRDNVFFLNIVL
jgi:hypothetical protein